MGKHKLKVCILKYCNSYTYGGGHGLCPNHYKQSASLVKNGVTTWEQLKISEVAK